MTHEYDQVFYNYINEGAVASAQKLLPALVAALPHPVGTVLDVGCGAGAWLSVWKSLGSNIIGLDGEYVDTNHLLIDAEEFIATDLSQGFSLDRKFDLAQSLEVAEHLPEASAERFVASLCRHSDFVLFSAATPGQGGENHINEQPYSYWREQFKRQGYAMYDPVRATLIGDTSVKPWYRYNTFLYVNELSNQETLHSLAEFLVDQNHSPKDIAPLRYRVRKQFVRTLPNWLTNSLAVAKKHIFS